MIIMISVCMATYNGEKYIKKQLDSILSQLSESDEVIISDDSSQDATLQIIKEIQDTRIKLLPDNQFYNPIFNFENALKYAKGDIIFLSDQDDIWLPNKVAVLTKVMEINDIAFSNACIINENEQIIREHFFESSNNCGFWKNILFNHYFGATMVFRKNVLQKALPFPKYIPMHDQWIGLIGEKYFKTFYVNEPLILYRRHGANISYTSEKSKNSFFRKVLYRIRIAFAITLR